MKCKDNKLARACETGDGLTRRDFMVRAGGATMTLVFAGVGKTRAAVEQPAWIASYHRLKVARLSEIRRHTPIRFEYPDENSGCFLVQMEGAAGGGVGPERDIVAFHETCPHMGGPLWGTYRAEYGAAGPCPAHLSSFDLRRHGMVIAGHSTESLPQIVLEVEGPWIVATGVMGLIYGRISNTGS